MGPTPEGTVRNGKIDGEHSNYDFLAEKTDSTVDATRFAIHPSEQSPVGPPLTGGATLL